MFPIQENKIENLKIDDEKTTISGKSFLFDFNTGDVVLNNGKPVEVNGYEALKMWIKKIIKTDKNKFDIYENIDYGVSDFREILTNDWPYGFKKAEIEREIKEALLKNTQIKSVENFEFERCKRNLNVKFDVYTVFGVVESEVSI